MDYLEKIIGDIEEHSVEGIRACFQNGISPNALYNNQPLILELTSEYTRTPDFKNCVRAFVDHGLEFSDKALLAVLLDDADALRPELEMRPAIIHKKYNLRCAYTPLEGVTLLHICAEFNLTETAKLLFEKGADVNAKAAIDGNGFGGQTPVFHTVNQNSNNSEDMLDFLISRQADLSITVKGLIWGKSYPWESFIPSVNPVSYAMMGLLPQMHRNVYTTAKIISRLLKSAYDIDYKLPNIPNKYLGH